MAEATLGISLGSRHLGIAVLRDHRLVHFQMKTFPGVWNERKLRRIMQAITELSNVYTFKVVAVKIPDPLPASKAYVQLVGSINVSFQSHRIPVRYYTLKELKRSHAGTEKISRANLIENIVKKYPVLQLEYHREQRNKEGYYYKMFEAVLCADM